jgi:hypothetical protein
VACHKTMKAGDILYVNDVTIRAAYRATISVEASKEMLIAHATSNQPGGYPLEIEKTKKE